MWIKRDISSSLAANSAPVQIVRGPRQCGKSSLILRLDRDFVEASLDDPALRELAQSDPEVFLEQFKGKRIFIDEAQYAPALFPSIKRRVDILKRSESYEAQTVFRLTGSNQILMDKNIKETLVGRATYFDLNTLSVSEILAAKPDTGILEIVYKGGWPELHARDVINTKEYLDDYINTYLEKDIVLAAGIQKSSEFLKFTRLLAGRVGQLLDYASLAKAVGVDAKTVKEWVSVLEHMHIVALVPAYASNASKRLIKTPKIFFIDTGLACRLQGWAAPEPILTSPQYGHLFENLVFSELYKTNINHRLGWQVYHWRTKEKHEIDFLVEMSPQKFVFIEAKVSAQRPLPLRNNPEIKAIFKDKIPQSFVCHQEGNQVLAGQCPVAILKDHLLSLV